MINIAIVIPTHNRQEELSDILDDLDKQELEKVQLSKIIVVDGSTDGTLEMLKFRKGVSVIKGEGDLWYTRSMNLGFRAAIDAGNDFVITLNDDCKVDSDFVSQLLRAYGSKREKCIMGSMSFSIEPPQQVIFAGISKIDWWRYKVHYYIPQGNVPDRTLTGIRTSKSLPGRGILIPIDIFKAIGLFDERFVQYYSDSEFVFRCQKNGFPAYISYDSKVYTYLSKTGQGSIHSKESLIKFVRNFGNVYARNYLPNISRVIWMYGIKPLWPFTMLVKILGHLKAYTSNKS